jgi:TatD DNase family protein
MLVDCHTHLESFSHTEISQVLERARAAGVGHVISSGTTLQSSRRSVDLSGAFPALYAGVGVHPMDVKEPIGESTIEELRKLATSARKVVVISEIGVEFTEGAPDRALQYQAFREQIRLARQVRLPIVFHSRDSHDEALRLLREEGAYEVGGAMHYFQADGRTAREAIDLGFHISLARPLLRLPELQKIVEALPLESIVLESDAAPQPFKAKRENWTEPRHVRLVAKKLADVKGKSVEEVETTTTENVRRLFGERWSEL